MAFARRKTQEEATTVSTAEKIEQLKATIANLTVIETEAVAAAVEAYKSSSRPPEPEGQAAIRRTAELLLQGVNVLERPEPAARRLLVADERAAAVREALRLARHQLQQLHYERSHEVEQEILAEWRPHLTKVIEHVNALRRLAAERRVMLSRWEGQTGIRPDPIGCDVADQLIAVNNGMADDPNDIHGDSTCGQLLAAAAQLGID